MKPAPFPGQWLLGRFHSSALAPRPQVRQQQERQRRPRAAACVTGHGTLKHAPCVTGHGTPNHTPCTRPGPQHPTQSPPARGPAPPPQFLLLLHPQLLALGLGGENQAGHGCWRMSASASPRHSGTGPPPTSHAYSHPQVHNPRCPQTPGPS